MTEGASELFNLEHLKPSYAPHTLVYTDNEALSLFQMFLDIQDIDME